MWNDDQAKLDPLHCLIKNMAIHADAAAINRAQKIEFLQLTGKKIIRVQNKFMTFFHKIN